MNWSHCCFIYSMIEVQHKIISAGPTTEFDRVQVWTLTGSVYHPDSVTDLLVLISSRLQSTEEFTGDSVILSQSPSFPHWSSPTVHTVITPSRSLLFHNRMSQSLSLDCLLGFGFENVNSVSPDAKHHYTDFLLPWFMFQWSF